MPAQYSSVRVGVCRREQGDRLLVWLCYWSPPWVKGARKSQHTIIPSLIASGVERVGLCPGGRVWV